MIDRVYVGLLLAAALCSQDPSAPLSRRGVLGVPFSPLPAAQATALGLAAGEGLVAGAPLPGLTGERAGLRAGDVVVAIDGKAPIANGLATMLRGMSSGQLVRFAVRRDGQALELSAPLAEKPRDPGNANYTVVYDHVVSHGQRMRTMLTLPKKPGRHPALMFVQGFAPVSYDFTLATATGDVSSLDGPILHAFADDGFVTLRVEKPGVGDSEGGPFVDVDYHTELDIYRQALKQLEARAEVDGERVFLFGHSMGGAFGPMIASEIPVRGLCVYGVASRTSYEYLVDTLRYQSLLIDNDRVAADERVRLGSRVLALVFHENRSPAQVKAEHPELAAFVDQLMPGGLFQAKTLTFWRQLWNINMAQHWAKVKAPVLAVRGGSDHVVYDVDHRLIAEVVNAVHPGYGKSLTLPASDHLFHDWPTEADSLRNFGKGKFNPAFIQVMRGWIDEVLRGK